MKRPIVKPRRCWAYCDKRGRVIGLWKIAYRAISDKPFFWQRGTFVPDAPKRRRK